MKNILKSLFGKKAEQSPFTGCTIPEPGAVTVHRHWTDDPSTDLTLFIVGGQVESKVKDDIKALLAGEAHITHYGKKRTKAKLVGLTGSMGMI